MMQVQPTTVALLQSVIEFMRDTAAPELSGKTAFHARVAINVLDIVKRELELSPAAEVSEVERLRRLLDRQEGGSMELNRELCNRIARGDMTMQTPGLASHLWDVAVDRLAIDQPNYSTYLRAVKQRKTETLREESAKRSS